MVGCPHNAVTYRIGRFHRPASRDQCPGVQTMDPKELQSQPRRGDQELLEMHCMKAGQRVGKLTYGTIHNKQMQANNSKYMQK
jgi:hypothetical protein